jgi:hypothetical protein
MEPPKTYAYLEGYVTLTKDRINHLNQDSTVESPYGAYPQEDEDWHSGAADACLDLLHLLTSLIDEE